MWHALLHMNAHAALKIFFVASCQPKCSLLEVQRKFLSPHLQAKSLGSEHVTAATEPSVLDLQAA